MMTSPHATGHATPTVPYHLEGEINLPIRGRFALTIDTAPDQTPTIKARRPGATMVYEADLLFDRVLAPGISDDEPEGHPDQWTGVLGIDGYDFKVLCRRQGSGMRVDLLDGLVQRDRLRVWA